MSVLSIQSAVTYGHVGNSAARPILQAMGRAVWAIDTVVFSNHPGHGRFRGRVQNPSDLAELLAGLAELQIFGQVRAVLSGYLGDAANGALVARAVKQIKAVSPCALFVLDPVMGDFDSNGKERMFVGAGVPETLLADLLPLADLITPNRFELTRIVGRTLASANEALTSIYRLRAHLARPDLTVIVTGFDAEDVPLDAIDTLILTAKGNWRVRQPRMPRRFDGAGDSFTALLLANLLDGWQEAAAAVRAISALAPILTDAARRHSKDLDLTAFLSGLRCVAPCFVLEEINE